MPRPPAPRPSPLDNPHNASHAWRRYRMLMWGMGAATLVTIFLVWAYLWSQFGLVSIHLYIATFLGIGLTMMLMAALMGLVFLSSGTGHDESIDDPLDDEIEWGGPDR
ncbi:hypothetical protein [Novosphingobium olei]|uniref:hypothetical protein n=1 Tax=Novosphingobium olei TaxID=2728851 RepID=UPI0030889246|nr:YfhO family protein [Novosphingobium olei]